MRALFEFVAGGGSIHDGGGVDSVFVVVPQGFDVVDDHFSFGATGAVGGDVAKNPFEPGAEWCVVAVLVGALDGSRQCVLGEVGGEVVVADQSAGEVVERRDLGDEIVWCHRVHLHMVAAAQTTNAAPNKLSTIV